MTTLQGDAASLGIEPRSPLPSLTVPAEDSRLSGHLPPGFPGRGAAVFLRLGRRCLCLLVLAAGCRCGHAGAPSSSRVLTEADSGRSLALAVGESFSVELRSTPGTGYSWDLTGGDPAVVVQRGPRSSLPEGSGLPGSPVLETIPFVAQGPGATRLEMAYRRPWERDAAPARTFAMDVTVK